MYIDTVYVAMGLRQVRGLRLYDTDGITDGTLILRLLT